MCFFKLVAGIVSWVKPSYQWSWLESVQTWFITIGIYIGEHGSYIIESIIIVSTLWAMVYKETVSAICAIQSGLFGGTLILIVARERASMIHLHLYLCWRALDIGHWTLDIIVSIISVSSLSAMASKKPKLEICAIQSGLFAGTLILIIAGEPLCMIHLHLYLYMRTLDIMAPTIIVSSLSGIVKISNLCNLERVVWLNPHSDHN